MKTKIVHRNVLYTADTPIEIRALQVLREAMVIEWRWRSDQIMEDETEIVGIWPFRKEIKYVTDNPWERIKVVDDDGEPDTSYMIRIPDGNTPQEVDQNQTNPRLAIMMEEFITLRNRLTNYGELLKFREEVSEINKSHWCKVHGVSEFIEVDDYDETEIKWK
jgi:hypothetical protein